MKSDSSKLNKEIEELKTELIKQVMKHSVCFFMRKLEHLSISCTVKLKE